MNAPPTRLTSATWYGLTVAIATIGTYGFDSGALSFCFCGCMGVVTCIIFGPAPWTS